METHIAGHNVGVALHTRECSCNRCGEKICDNLQEIFSIIASTNMRIAAVSDLPGGRLGGTSPLCLQSLQ